MGIKQNKAQDVPRGKHAKAASDTVPENRNTATSPQQSRSRTGAAGNVAQGSFKPAFPNNGNAKKRNRTIAIVGASVLCVLAIVYCAFAAYFSGHCYPNTTLGDEDISFMSSSDIEAVLNDVVSSYSVNVSGDGLSFTVSASEAGASIESAQIAQDILSQNNPLLWPLGLFSSHDMTERISITTGDSGMAEKVRVHVEEFNASAEPSADAYISFDSSESSFVIMPEVYGTTVDPDAVVKSVDLAIRSLESTVVIGQEHLLKPSVVSTDPALEKACDQANLLASSRLEFLVSGVSVAKVDSATIANWIVLNDDFSVSLNESAVQSWVDSVAGQINTYGSTRTYTRPDGKQCTVSGGVYGWIVDNDSFRSNVIEYVSSGAVGTYDVPMKQTAASFEGVGKQDWGTRYIDVDLAQQHAVFYDNGTVIWESDIVSGKPDGEHDTPTGIYLVNSKESPSKLIGEMEPETGKPEYETTVDYWMPFVANSVGFHDASWQSSFGGSRYAEGYGSHGCVNLPVGAASSLYGLLQVGDIVVVHG